MVENVGAGIVLYNPDIQRLKENIAAILPQVEEVILLDNGSENIEDIEKLLLQYKKMTLIRNASNLGVAKALNQIIDYSFPKGYSWVLTLDQDSVCDDDLIKILYTHTAKPKIGIIGPGVIDRNKPLYKQDDYLQPRTYKEVEEIITSGSLTNVAAVKQVGMFNEALFIDEVDNEMCIRLRLGGYKIIKDYTTTISHELGNASPYYIFPRLGKLFHIEFFKRPKYSMNHSNMRKYYIVRNNVFVLRKYKGKNMYNRKEKRKRFIKMVILWSVLEPFTVKKWKATIKGMLDGFRMKINEEV